MDADVIEEWLSKVVVPGLLSLLFAVAIALARKWIGRLEDARIREILEELVRAAEQMFGEQGKGEEKLAYVTEKLQHRGLEKRLTRVNIEAAVNRTFPRSDVWPDAEGEGA